ncbi:SMP-30/gluconolactonase/LRE family protein [Streptomyces phaeochromogenes]|uniref:SMP-30/gluconolactonase/LRE family protein n=1 Tax=Streptomyces phaeochromogenes TaxID=1923 RepID=UPI00369C6CAF
MPTGFFPEGIAIGNGPTAYITSLANGDVYRLNLVTGAGRVLTPGPGTGAVGIAFDACGRLFVAGGQAGTAWVINPATGRVVTTYRLGAEGSSFVNDFVFTRDAAWITDSSTPVLYKLPLGRRGALPSQADVVRIPLGGDIAFESGFNANGIAQTPDGKALLVVQTNSGLLFPRRPPHRQRQESRPRRRQPDLRRRDSPRRKNPLRGAEHDQYRRRGPAQRGRQRGPYHRASNRPALRHPDHHRALR